MKKWIIGMVCGFLLSQLSVADEQKKESVDLNEINKAMSELKLPYSAENFKKEIEQAEIDIFSKKEELSKYVTDESITLNQVSFDRNRLLVAMKKWGQIKLDVIATSKNKDKKWTGPCSVKLYVGYNVQDPSLGDKKMILFRSECEIITLPTNQEQSILFFIPGDIRKRYGLAQNPDYCAIKFRLDGYSQGVQIVAISDKQGTLQKIPSENAKKIHNATKAKSDIKINIMRNVDQLPIYADIKISNHPTLAIDNDIVS